MLAVAAATYSAESIELLEKTLPTWVVPGVPLVIWDNGNSRQKRNWLRRQPGVSHVLGVGRNLGCHIAWNRLIMHFWIDHPEVEHLLIPNADVAMEPNAIWEMHNLIRENTHTGFVAWPQANCGFPVSEEGYVEEVAHECMMSNMLMWRESGVYSETMPAFSADSCKSTVANMFGWKTRLVRGKGDGYTHLKDEQDATREQAKHLSQCQTDNEYWGHLEGRFVQYWSKRLTHEKGAI
jgi:hypothetical protein